MANPTQSAVHVDRMLTNISVAYMQTQRDYISSKVFPIVPVAKQSDKYWVYDKADWLRDEARLRADATESAGSGYRMSSDSYFADVWAFHKDIGPQARANADDGIDLDADASRFVTQKLLLRQEVQWVNDFWGTGKWTGGTGADPTPGVKWDAATGDPQKDIDTEAQSIFEKTGFYPNTIVVPAKVNAALKRNVNVRELFKYTQGGVITEQLLAGVFGVDNYYIARAVKNSSNEGDPTPTYLQLFGDEVWLGYVAPNPGLMTPSAGYTFVWRGVSDGYGENIGIRRWDMPELGPATRVEGQIAMDNKIVGAELGVFFQNTLT